MMAGPNNEELSDDELAELKWLRRWVSKNLSRNVLRRTKERPSQRYYKEYRNTSGSCTARDHAYFRALWRLNWSKDKLDRKMVIASQQGIHQNDTLGTKLYEYFDFYRHRKDKPPLNNVRVYKGVTYLFQDNELQTIYPLRPELTDIATRIERWLRKNK